MSRLNSLEEKIHKSWPRVELFGVVIILIAQAIEMFYGLVRYHYIFPSGGDMFTHLGMIKSILGGQTNPLSYGYPPLFHFITAFFAWSLHTNYISTTTYMVPSLVLVSGLAIWFLARNLFGPKIALLAYFLYALVSLQPLQTVNDGGLPNLVGGHIILPLVIIIYFYFWTTKGAKKWGYLAGLLVALALLFEAHHLSTLIGLAVMISAALPLTIWQIRTSRGWSNLASLVAGLGMWLAVFLIFVYLFFHLDILKAARDLTDLFLIYSNSWPFVIIHNNGYAGSPVIPLNQYGQVINGLTFQGGLLGSLWLLWEIVRKRQPFPLITLVIWWWIMFIGSQFAWVGEPDRLVRDLSLPSSLLSAYFIVQLGMLLRAKNRVIFWAFMVCILLLLVLGVSDKANTATKYNHMVYVTGADTALEKYIQNADSKKPFYVIDPTDLLTFYFENEIKSNKAVIINSLPSAKSALSDKSCVAVGYFASGVWPDTYLSQENLNALAETPGTTTNFITSDQEKTWYAVCPK